MTDVGVLRKLEGLHTAETAARKMGITRQAAINLLSKLKKERHVTVSGGGRMKRLYKITVRKQRPRDPGMFDIINRHSPMKLAEWYDHQVHGSYGVEDALVDAIQTRSFRAILASMRLFQHIRSWKKLHKLARKRGCWEEVGALYDVARQRFRVKKMPARYRAVSRQEKRSLIPPYGTKDHRFANIEKEWRVSVPFKEGDLRKAEAG